MPAVALSHSVNSSGRMGLFVDSSSCSCSGCSTYRAQTLDIPLLDAADAHLFTQSLFTGPGVSNSGQDTAPAPAPAPSPSPSSGVTDGSALVMASGGAGVSVATEQPCIWAGRPFGPVDTNERCSCRRCSGPPVALARTVTGLGWASVSADGGGASTSTSIFSPTPLRTDVDALMDGLRGLRAELQIQQDHVYDEGYARSHDEMAAQDAEWDDLDRKIDAIETVMLSFGAIFRTR